MSSPARRAVLPVLALAVGLGTVLAPPTVSVQAAPAAAGVAASATAGRLAADPWVGAGGYTYPRPTNAAKIFRWGVEEWRDEFEVGGLRSRWTVRPRGTAGQQYGQITLDARARTGTVTALATDPRADRGRWEARIRAKRYDRRTPYTFYWELVPVGRYRCGGRSIVMAKYQQDDRRVRGGVRVKNEVEFSFRKELDLRSGYFHTFAVEVTRDHVSWFVDRQVVRTERRPAVTQGVMYRPRLRMEAVDGKRMARSRLQADWVRYYDLSRPNARSIHAPRMTKRPYHRTHC